MVSLKGRTAGISLALIIGLLFFLSFPLGAQGLSPYFNPLLYYGNFFNYRSVPTIRTANPYPSYGSAFGSPWSASSFNAPAPLFRTATATITLWLTTGHSAPSILLVYNPTALIGPTAAPITPSPLLSLIAGTLLTAGADPLSTANPAFFNYLVNSFLLPTGLAIYAIP